MPNLHRGCARAALVGTFLLPVAGWAANGNMPRTPALFPPHACLTIVDRTVDPILPFSVHIPFEDTALTEDELPDSRRFSFFGLCRDPGRLEVLPNWIAMDDAQRALDLGIIDALPASTDVLFDAETWSAGHGGAGTCVQRMLDEPVPIACEALAEPLGWDTTTAPAGNYVVRGYTFAPPSNLWTTRTGVVQIHDGQVLPVATLVSPTYDATAYQEDGYRVLGCMAGPAGTTVSLQWASTTHDDLQSDAAWTEFAALDAAAGEIDEHFATPPDTVYLGLLLRAVATGPDGAQWIGQAPGFVTIYPGDGTSDPPQSPAPPDHCMAGGDTSGGLGDDTGDGSTTGTGGDLGTSAGDGTSAPAQDEDGGGCGCAAGGGPARVSLALPCLVLLRRRRGTWARRGARASWPGDVSQHQDPLQLRAARDRG